MPADTEAQVPGLRPGPNGGGRPSPASRHAPQTEVPQVPDWLPLSQLEHAAPNAAVLLAKVWGTPAAGPALRALVFDREGLVRRWSLAFWPELTVLCGVHRSLHGADADSVPDLAQLATIEVRFAHLARRLLHSWGHVEAFAVVCHDCMFDHRGDRAGWPTEVFQDLVLLQQVHDRVYGPLPEGRQPWRDFFISD